MNSSSSSMARGLGVGLILGLVAGGGAGWWLASSTPGTKASTEEGPGAFLGTPTPAGLSDPAAVAREAVYQEAVAAAGRLSLEDLGEVLGEVRGVANPAKRNAVWRGVLERLPKERWPELARAFATLSETMEFTSNPFESLGVMELMTLFCQHVLETDPEFALARQLANPEEGSEVFGPMVFQFWVHQDTARATAFFEKEIASRPDTEGFESYVSELAKARVWDNPEAAFDWIATLPEEINAEVAGEAMKLLIGRDPAVAAQVMLERPELLGFESFAPAIASAWAEQDPDAALAWARGLPPDKANAALGPVMQKLMEQDVARALREVKQLTIEQRDSALRVLSAAAGEDATVVAELVGLIDTQPEGPGRSIAAWRTMQSWAAADEEAASRWVAALSEGATKDSAILGLAHHLITADGDPDAGLEWLAATSQPNRASHLQDGIERWAGFDAPAARSWVKRSPRLSAAERERLLPLTQSDP